MVLLDDEGFEGKVDCSECEDSVYEASFLALVALVALVALDSCGCYRGRFGGRRHSKWNLLDCEKLSQGG